MPVGDDLNVVRVLKRKADIDSVVIHISVDNGEIMIIQRFENAKLTTTKEKSIKHMIRTSLFFLIFQKIRIEIKEKFPNKTYDVVRIVAC